MQLFDDSPRGYRFIGRRDHLIKDPGHRIDLGEAKAATYGHDKVEECVAVALPEPSDEQPAGAGRHLHGSWRDDGGRAHARARGRLGSCRVPDHVEIIGALPRTPNDKYGRTQLARQGAAPIGW